MKTPVFRMIFLFIIFALAGNSNSLIAQNNWVTVKTKTLCTERHENAFVKCGTKFYLLGGRGIEPVEIYDPETKMWTKGAIPPIEISHFQAVSLHGLIYVLGAFTGNWPYETPIGNIFIYNPVLDNWIIGPPIPYHRQRGAAGAVVHNEKIYLVGGIVNGHTSGWVSWFDEYDPATNSWKELSAAPYERDHFQTAVTNNKLVVAGGRKSGYKGKGFEETVAKTDIYNFKTGRWTTLPSPEGDIPTERAGCSMVSVGDEVIILGGESGTQKIAHNEVEALNIKSGKWQKLPQLETGRHGTQASVDQGFIYTAAGCGNRGGTPELNSLERYDWPDLSSPIANPIRAGALRVSAKEHTFQKTLPNNSKSATFQLINTRGNQGIPIQYISITGSKNFELDFPYSLPYILPPESSISLNVKFSPENNRPSDATLLIKDGISNNAPPAEIILKGN